MDCLDLRRLTFWCEDTEDTTDYQAYEKNSGHGLPIMIPCVRWSGRVVNVRFTAVDVNIDRTANEPNCDDAEPTEVQVAPKDLQFS